MSKTLIVIGIVLVVLGLLWNVIPIGRLPGDFHFKGQNTQVFFPLTTSILLSLILSAIFYFTRR